MALITLSAGARQALGQSFTLWIQAGLDQKGTGPTGWWREVERFYRNEAPESPGKGIVPWHVPISQPRQDALTANVCTVIAKQEPMMLCDIEDTDLADRREKAVHKAWQDGGFEIQLRKVSTDATNVNKGFFKLTPRAATHGRESGPGTASGMQRSPGASQCPGVEISVIKPNDMSVYPAVMGGCQEAVLVGNRLWKTIGSCKALIASGAYYKQAMEPADGDPSAHDETGGKDRSGSIENISPDLDTRGAEIWDCIVEYDLSEIEGAQDGPKGSKRYRATVAIATNELLALEAYPEHFRYKWYFEAFYIPDGENYWSGLSVARNLKSLQDAYNKLAAAFYTYALSAARPLVIGPPLSTGETYSQWEAGAYAETDEVANVWQSSVTFQGQPLVVQMQQIERIADMVARVSQNTMGSIQGHTTTATTDSIVASGVAVGIEEYISNFSTPLPLMAEHTEDVLAGMWDEVSPYYLRPAPDQDKPEDGGAGVPGQVGPVGPVGQGGGSGMNSGPAMVPLLSFDELAVPCSWKCNGTSPSATPQARVQAAMQMAELAQDPAFGIDKYALGTVISKDSPLTGTGDIQIPKEEVQEMMAQQQQAEQAAANPPPPQPHITDIVDSKMAALMTPMEFGEFLRQIGITPDPRRSQMPIGGNGAEPAGTTGQGDQEGGNAQPAAGPGGAGGGAGPHDAALAGAMASPELGQIAQAMAAGGGGQMPSTGSGGGGNAPGAGAGQS